MQQADYSNVFPAKPVTQKADYGLDEVLLHLFEKTGSHNHLYVCDPVLENYEDAEDVLYELTSSEYSRGAITLTLPQFTSLELGDGVEQSFAAKTFNLNVLSIKKEMGDCYEGKTWFDYVINVVDRDNKQQYEITSSFYAATDRELTDISIVKVK